MKYKIAAQIQESSISAKHLDFEGPWKDSIEEAVEAFVSKVIRSGRTEVCGAFLATTDEPLTMDWVQYKKHNLEQSSIEVIEFHGIKITK